MIQGFKDFIMRGNVIELAVAVVIGTAFTALVTAIVNSIINPLIELFYKPDPNSDKVGPSFTGLHGDPVVFPLGGLLTAIISFFAVAIVVYLVFVVPMNKWKERQAAKAGVVEEEAKLPTEAELLVQIRDLLEQQRGTGAPTRVSEPPSPSI
ncbi:large conductance mechanosensitive channel protein MscL [Microbacterium oleivorans]|uniref:large conductance mechanosensitive channel protein MscL n=1 Tax=Microbacterium TaxID=33882 RepID=UPI0020411A6C|nr:large conductance mechanosensitive channel protein MscL [Microbacterium oleivorans]MCM3696020.1 large conductance mechanosensitive channel protein MscL [Microbacterium oleivorans]